MDTSRRLNLVVPTKITIEMEGVQLSSPSCQNVLVAFQENIRQALGTVGAPGWAAMITMQWNMAFNNAAVDMWGADFLPHFEKATPEQRIELDRRQNELMKEIVEKNSPLLRKHLEVNTNSLEKLARACGPYVYSMMEGILKTLCIQAWTVMEVLIEDLHNDVLDDHSKAFSPVVIEMRERRKQSLKGKKFGFRKREDFRYSYEVAFNGDAKIRACIEDRAIDALCATRNLLVHKAGIVDQDFLAEIAQAPLLNGFESIRENRPLLFDGDVVFSIVDASFKQGYSLIRAVNEWLMAKHLASLKS